MQKYYNTLNKEKKKEIKNIYQKEYKKSNLKARLTRLKIYSAIGYIFSIIILIDAFLNESNKIGNIVIAITLLIASTIFLIGEFYIKQNVLNKIALKNK